MERAQEPTALPDLSDYTVIVFSGIDWAFRRHHHFVARGFARAGARLLFVENTGVRWPGPRDLKRLGRRIRNVVRTLPSGAMPTEPGIRVMPPRVLPVHGSRLLRELNRRSLVAQIRRTLPDLDPSRTIVWIGLPNWTSLDVARSLHPRLTVYWNADEFARVPGAHSSIRSSESAVIDAADLVFTTSERLQKLSEREGRTPIRIRGLVDVRAFSEAAKGTLPRPADLASLPGRIIGNMGGINHKLDRELLEQVAAAYPGDSLVLLGGVEDDHYLPRPAPNIHVLGSRPPATLPAYVQHFDVCLVPYARGEFTDSVFPAKICEYLAAGRPVVSTGLPEIRQLASVVSIAEDRASFVAAVGRALDDPGDADLVRARIATADLSSHEIVVPAVLRRVEAAL